MALALAVFTARAEAPAPANAMCPVMTLEKVEPNIYTDFEGKRVWFCCAKCRNKFIADPDAYLDRLPQFGARGATATTPEPAPSAAPAKPALASLPRTVRWLGKFHLPSVHFPLALLVFAAATEALAWRTRSPLYAAASRVAVLGAALGAAIAAPLGWAAAAHTPIAPESLAALGPHRWLGTATAALALAAAWTSERRQRTGGSAGAYRVLLFGAALLVLLTGLLGGILTQGFDHYVF